MSIHLCLPHKISRFDDTRLDKIEMVLLRDFVGENKFQHILSTLTVLNNPSYWHFIFILQYFFNKFTSSLILSPHIVRYKENLEKMKRWKTALFFLHVQCKFLHWSGPSFFTVFHIMTLSSLNVFPTCTVRTIEYDLLTFIIHHWSVTVSWQLNSKLRCIAL